jgi:hypothetical protein
MWGALKNLESGPVNRVQGIWVTTTDPAVDAAHYFVFVAKKKAGDGENAEPFPIARPMKCPPSPAL